mmetsp:Transcript_2286/g.4912  ORF Transcript_2286/g.4912 Transcript_2286/m.4912 type:complete len:82 (+) Transcript_2286:55-300(+)
MTSPGYKAKQIPCKRFSFHLRNDVIFWRNVNQKNQIPIMVHDFILMIIVSNPKANIPLPDILCFHESIAITISSKILSNVF